MASDVRRCLLIVRPSIQPFLWSALRPAAHPLCPYYGTLNRHVPLARVDRRGRILLLPLEPLPRQHGAVLHPDPPVAQSANGGTRASGRVEPRADQRNIAHDLL